MEGLNWDSFKTKFHSSWHLDIKPIIESKELFEIYKVLKQEKKLITPDSKNVFKCFEIDKNLLKVVIMGMSPYPQISFSSRKASGLAFDCSLYGDVSPSLTKLYDAIENDCYNGLYLNNKDNKSLQYLVDQGVMLANKALTCCKGEPVSHIALWEPFWKMVFENIFNSMSGLIFIFMENDSQELIKYTNPLAHHILQCEHPVAASYKNREMKHNNVFSQCNELLKGLNGEDYIINWLK